MSRRSGAFAAIAAAIGVATIVVPMGISPPESSEHTFYVATTGSDSTGTGSRDRPWATIDKARVQLRTLAASQTRDYIVQVLPGTYQSTAVTFTDADSGLNGHQRIYRAMSGPGSARLVGGRILDTSTCSLDSGSIYSCPILSGDDFETFYIDGARATTARTPNATHDAHFTTQQAPYFLTQSTAEVHDVLKYSTSDVNLSGIAAADVRVVIQSGGQQEWWFDVIPVTSIDTTAHTITLSQYATYYLYNNSIASRYYLKGSCSWLDAAGEYCIDRSAHRVRMYGNPVGHELVVPTAKDVIRFVGTDTTHRAKNITIDGFQIDSTNGPSWFRYGAWGEDYPQPPFPPGTPSGPDWDPTVGTGHTWTTFAIQADTISANRHANVYATNADHVTLMRNHVLNSGFSDVYLFGTAQTFTISHNWFERAGYSTLELEGGYPSEGDVNTGHTVDANLYQRPGELVGHGRCIHAIATSSTYSNSECGLAPREGLMTTAVCTGNASASICYAANNTFSNFWVHDAVQDSSDAGGVYTASLKGNQSAPYATNTYSQIAVDRVFPNPAARYAITLPANGFYIDVNASGQVLSNVEVTNTRTDHEDNSAAHTLTNVSWVGGFSTSLMDYAHIGLDLAAFPYASAATQSFSDTLESGFGNWTTGQGSPVLSTTHPRSTTHAFCPADGDVKYHLTDGVLRRAATFWYYDDKTSLTAENLARADEETYSSGTFSNWNTSTSVWRGLGVSGSTSTNFYVAFYGGAAHATTVARSTGYHALTFNAESNDHMDMYVDGTLVASPTGVRQFNVLSMGDFVADGHSGTGCFDDISIAL